jgi:curved DNA-binding protein CbpA
MPSADASKPLAKNHAPDPYRMLGIERSATEAEIKRAYFQLVRQFPPEKAPEKFQEIRAAYEKLRTAESKAQVDLFLIQPPPEPPKRRRASYDLDVHREDLLTLALEMVATPMQQDFRS